MNQWPEPAPADGTSGADYIEVHEERDPIDPTRVLGTFELRFGGKIGEWDDAEGWEDDAERRDESDEDDPDWDAMTDEQVEEHFAALDRAEAEDELAAEAAARQHPHRRLTIDDAIELARGSSDDVRVFIGDGEEKETYWDASREPRGEGRRWPPADLDLRPRWAYEPADSTRPIAWWVRFAVRAEHVTPEIAAAAAASLPAVLAVRSVMAVDPVDVEGSGLPISDRQIVAMVCLVAPAEGASAYVAVDLMDALEEASRGAVAGSMSIGHWVLGPADPAVDLPPDVGS